jgi:hypothetical protein
MHAARTAVSRAIVTLLVATPLVVTVAPSANAAAGLRYRHGHTVGRTQHKQQVKIGTALRITRNADGSVTYSESP